MIMKGRAPLRLPWAGFAALAVVSMATLPAWASVSNDQQPAPAAQVAQKPTPTPTPATPPATTQVKPAPETAPAVVPSRRVTRAPAATTHVEVPVARHVLVAPAQETPHAVRHVTVTPAPHTQERVTTPRPTQRAAFSFIPAATELTDEGQKLVEKFTAQREAIQKEIDARVEAERQATIKQLQALQDQYAKAGKLDEAVAIRDYLKAGGPSDGSKMSWVIRRAP